MASLQLPVGFPHASLPRAAADQQLRHTELPTGLPSGVLTPQRRATLPVSREGSEQRSGATFVYPSSGPQPQALSSSFPSSSPPFPFVFLTSSDAQPGLPPERNSTAAPPPPAAAFPAAPGSLASTQSQPGPGNAAYLTSALSGLSSLPPGAVPTVSAPAFPYVVCPDGARAPSLSRVVPIILTSPLRRKKRTQSTGRRKSLHEEEAASVSASKSRTLSLSTGRARGGLAYVVSRGHRERAASAGPASGSLGENGADSSPARQPVREFTSRLPSDRSSHTATSLDRSSSRQPPSLFFVSPSAVTAEARPGRAAEGGETCARAEHTETERNPTFLSSPFHRSLPSSRNGPFRGPEQNRGDSATVSFPGVSPFQHPERPPHSHAVPPPLAAPGLPASSHLSSLGSSVSGTSASLPHLQSPETVFPAACSFSSVLGRSEEPAAPGGSASLHSSVSGSCPLAAVATPAFPSHQNVPASPRASAPLSSSGSVALVVGENQRSDFAEIAPNRWVWGVRLGERAWEAYRHQMALTSHFAVTSDEVARSLLQGKYPESLELLTSRRSSARSAEGGDEPRKQTGDGDESAGREPATGARRASGARGREAGSEEATVDRPRRDRRRRSSSEEDKALEDKLQEISDEDSVLSAGRRATPVFPRPSSVSPNGSVDDDAFDDDRFLDAVLSSSDEESSERREGEQEAQGGTEEPNNQAEERRDEPAGESGASVEHTRNATARNRHDVHLTMAPQLGAPVQPPLRDVVARTPLSLGAPHKARSRPSVQLRLDREANAPHRSSQERRTREGHPGRVVFSRRGEEASSPSSSQPPDASPRAGVPRPPSEAPLREPASCRRPPGPREDELSLRRHLFPSSPQSRRFQVPHAGIAEKGSSLSAGFPRPLPLLGGGAPVSLPHITVSSPAARRQLRAGSGGTSSPRTSEERRREQDEREVLLSGRVEDVDNLREGAHSEAGNEEGGRREDDGSISPSGQTDRPSRVSSRTLKGGALSNKGKMQTSATADFSKEAKRRRASDPGSLSDAGFTPHGRLLSPRERRRRRSEGSLEGKGGARNKGSHPPDPAPNGDRDGRGLGDAERLQPSSPASASSLHAGTRSEREKKTVAFAGEEDAERREEERRQGEEEERRQREERRPEKRQDGRQDGGPAREDTMSLGHTLAELARQHRETEDSDELRSVSSGTSLEDYLARRDPFRVSTDSETKCRGGEPIPTVRESRVSESPLKPSSLDSQAKLGEDTFSSPLEFDDSGGCPGDFFDVEPANSEAEERPEASGAREGLGGATEKTLRFASTDPAAKAAALGTEVGCSPSPDRADEAATPARLQLALPDASASTLSRGTSLTPLALSATPSRSLAAPHALADGEQAAGPLVLPPAVGSVQRGIQTSLPSSPETRASRRGRSEQARRLARSVSARLPVVTIGARLVEEPIADVQEVLEGEDGPYGESSWSPEHREAATGALASPARSDTGSKQRRYPLRQRLPALKPWLGEYARYGYKDGEWGLIGVSRCVNQDALRTVARDVTVDGVLGAMGGREEKKRQELLRSGRLQELAVDERQQMLRHGQHFKLADSGGEGSGTEGPEGRDLALRVLDAGDKKRGPKERKRRRELKGEEGRGKRERRRRAEDQGKGRGGDSEEREERGRRRRSGEAEGRRRSSDSARERRGDVEEMGDNTRDKAREKRSDNKQEKRHSKGRSEGGSPSDEEREIDKNRKGRRSGEEEGPGGEDNTHASDLTSTTYEEGQDGTRRLFTYKAVTLPTEWFWMNANAEGTLQTALLSRCGTSSHTLLLRLAPGETKPPIDSGDFVHYGVVTSGTGLRVTIGEKEAVLDAESVFFIPHHTVWSLFNRNSEDVDVYLTFWKVQ
nr:TPA: hypothetical protein BN1204_013160 [Neospora caninum Liverpool]